MSLSTKPMTFMYSRGAGSTSFQLSDAEVEKVRPVMEKLDRSSDAIRYLHDQGWSNAAICKVLVYPTDTMYHKRGDNLLPQHVATTISKYKQEKMMDPTVLPIKDPALANRLMRQGLIGPSVMPAKELDDEDMDELEDMELDEGGETQLVDLTGVEESGEPKEPEEEVENYKKAG